MANGNEPPPIFEYFKVVIDVPLNYAFQEDWSLLCSCRRFDFTPDEGLSRNVDEII